MTQMIHTVQDLDQVRWQHHEAIFYAQLDEVALIMFQNDVVKPAIAALERKLQACQASEDPAQQSLVYDNYADLRQSTIEGFLLTLQSVHERALRKLLMGMAGKKGWDRKSSGTLKNATWSSGKKEDGSLQQQFRMLLDVPISMFGNYSDLNILQLLANAIRHGDGRSAEDLHKACPSLWKNWLPPGTNLRIGQLNLNVPNDAPAHPRFEDITLPMNLLDQMFSSIFGFWGDIEYVRCNSFPTRGEDVEQHMAALLQKRIDREGSRVWSPS